MTATGFKHAEQHHNSKLTTAAVRDIRENYLAFVRGYGHYAKKYNVSDSTVRDVLSYRTWINDVRHWPTAVRS